MNEAARLTSPGLGLMRDMSSRPRTNDEEILLLRSELMVETEGTETGD